MPRELSAGGVAVRRMRGRWWFAVIEPNGRPGVLALPKGLIDVYANPPSSPDECVFALTTATISADLTTRITPCQFGGAPDCSNCGCIASAGLAAVARHHLWGFIPVGSIFTGSVRVGDRVRRLRPVQA